jgi:hypothetical protein
VGGWSLSIIQYFSALQKELCLSQNSFPGRPKAFQGSPNSSVLDEQQSALVYHNNYLLIIL